MDPPVPPTSELSSMSTAVEELARRITSVAEGLADTKADWVAQELFAVERSLVQSYRRLNKLTAQLSR
jgi:hypothetical protein